MTTTDYDNGYDDALDDVVVELERLGIPNARDIVSGLDSAPLPTKDEAARQYSEAVTRWFPSLSAAGRWFGLRARGARQAAEEGPPGSVEKLLRYMLATDQGPGAIDDAIRRGR